MARVVSLGGRALLLLSVGALVACNAIAGIGEPVLETSDPNTTGPGDDGGAFDANAATPGADAAAPSSDASGGGDDGGSTLDAAGTDADVADVDVPDTFTPPPPAAKPGFDLTAGGTHGKSAKFTLISVVGESPGGNNVGKSSHFVLKAGVIAVTQPN